MSFAWQLFRIVCISQLILAFLSGLSATKGVFEGNLMSAVVLFCMLMIVMLCLLAWQLLPGNYPDQPIEGAIKRKYNRLYLVNILVISLLFAKVFLSWKNLEEIADLLNTEPLTVPFQFSYPAYKNITMLLQQFILLYGLYVLRANRMRPTDTASFDFEKPQ